MRRSICCILVALLLTATLCVPVYAKEARYADTVTKAVGFDEPDALFDGARTTWATASAGKVTLSRKSGIAHMYIEFDRVPTAWTLSDGQKTVTCGQNGFLHEYVDVLEMFGEMPKKLTASFEDDTVIADVYAFSAGDLPDFVQTWSPPTSCADLLLISSHSDDEQLFFAGMLPYYAVERGLQVQVAYSVQHFEAQGTKNHVRPHEQLDGLWTVGVTNYPVMSDFPDLYAESKDRETALAQAKNVFASAGVTFEDFTAYLTDCLRRFKPLVVVSHDENGEYGHGTHVLTVAALKQALKAAPNKNKFKKSADAYGVWEVEKTYLHLYEKNKIVMDWDTPYESLGGKTPFEMTQAGFGCHKSQHWTWFYGWIYGKGTPITKASQIDTHSPCEFGLYKSTVGKDKKGGDFMENIVTYEQRKQQALEELTVTTVPTTTTTVTIIPQTDEQAGGWLPLVLLGLAGVAMVLALALLIKRITRRGKH